MSNETIAIQEIRVEGRMRKVFGDIPELAASLARFGLLNPVVIDGENNLIAGHRRILAAKHLGWPEIPYRRLDQLDPVVRKEIELEENIRRKDLEWQEEVIGLYKLYNAKQERYGEKGSPLAVEGGYGIEEAARELDRATGSISMDLALAKGLHEFPELLEEKTKSSAFKRYRRLKETQLRGELAKRKQATDLSTDPDIDDENFDEEAENEEGSKAPTGIQRQPIRKALWKGLGVFYHADARDVLRQLPAGAVDLIVTDPPYGIGLYREGAPMSSSKFAESQGAGYGDNPKEIMDMLDETFLHAARVLKPDGHAYIFFHMTRYEPIYLMLRKHFGTCEETPIIWIKQTTGIGDPNRSWIYTYEPCFWVNRGRGLVKPQPFNTLKYDTVSKKIHSVEKPVALMRHLIEASGVNGEVVLDPFAGSGSTLVAAAQLGMRFMGIERHADFWRSAVDRVSRDVAAQAETDATPTGNGPAPESDSTEGVSEPTPEA
jgi:DNA modification methylase/ParB-like chromosome segregation protein Spo0J